MVRSLATDPLRNFKYNVLIPRNDTGIPGGMARLGFMSATGLGMQAEPVTYREGGDNVTTRKMPGQTDFNPITLSRGMFPQDYDNWYWFRYIFNVIYGGGLSFAGGPDFRSDIYINVLEHPTNGGGAGTTGGVSGWDYTMQNIVKISFKIYSAWPSALQFSDFDAGGNAVAVEQLTLMHEGIDVKYAPTRGTYVPVGAW